MAASIVLIIGLTLIRAYLSVVVMAYARQVLQRYMQHLVTEDARLDEQAGPFAVHLPGGDWRKGWMGRLMMTSGRRYWLATDETGERSQQLKSTARVNVAGEV